MRHSKPHTFNLQHAISTWRRSLEYNPVFREEDLDELERHLLDHVKDLESEGLGTEAAFLMARSEIGSFDETEAEYRKTRWASIKKRHHMKDELAGRLSILRNYVTIALRSFKKHPLYAFLNVGGLSIGFAVCFLIFLFIRHELSYDTWFDRAEDIYRVTSRGQSLATSGALAPALTSDFPQIESTTRVSERWGDPLIKWDDKSVIEDKFMFVDSTFFSIFNFELVQGDPDKVLTQPFSVVVTESAARSYFGSEDPMGKTLNIKSLWDAFDFTVTGVVKDTRQPSHISFNMLASFHTRFSAEPYPENVAKWLSVGDLTYLKLNTGQSIETLEAGMPEFIVAHMGERLRDTDKDAEALKQRFQFQSILDAHFSPTMQSELEPGADPKYMSVFGWVAAIVLIIASVNYINITTARAMVRAREVGVRKVVGAHRSQILWQFMAESTCVVGGSIVLGFVLAGAALPFFNDITHKTLGIPELVHPSMLLFVLVSGLLVAGISGLYPAVLTSRFQPVHILKGLVTGKHQNSRFRQLLVISQFASAVVLIMGALVVNGQLEFMQNKNLGMNPDQVLILGNKALSSSDATILKETLLGHSSIVNVSSISGDVPVDPTRTMKLMKEAPTGQKLEGEVWKQALHTSVGLNFLETMEIELLQGRNFTELDLARGQEFTPIWVNETAVSVFEWDDPIGQELKCCWSPTPRVVGVIKDFHVQSLKAPIDALALMPSAYSSSVLIRVHASQMTEALEQIKQVWNEMAPGWPLDITFMDDQFEAAYSAELRLANVFNIFAVLAVIIASLGLFGLSTFMAQTRTREIGIRKVMGATGIEIIRLLTKDVVVLIGIALLIAIPIAINLGNQWLQEFPYRTSISVGVILFASITVLVTSLLTVGFQSNRAANINPSDALRHE